MGERIPSPIRALALKGLGKLVRTLFTLQWLQDPKFVPVPDNGKITPSGRSFVHKALIKTSKYKAKR